MKFVCRVKVFFFLCLFSASVVVQAPCQSKSAATTAHAPSLMQPPAAGQVWSLRQSSILLGDFDVLVGVSGLRASCKRSGITFVSRPPLWQPIGFSGRSQSVWYTTAAQFHPAEALMKSLSVFGGIPNVSNIPLHKRGRKVVYGLDCLDMATDEKYAAAQLVQCKQGYISNLQARSAEYQGAQLGLPAPVLTMLENIYGLPHGNTLPLFFRYINFNHGVKLILMTKSCSVTTPANDWLAVPSGLKKVSSFQELQMDAGAKSGIENLF